MIQFFYSWWPFGNLCFTRMFQECSYLSRINLNAWFWKREWINLTHTSSQNFMSRNICAWAIQATCCGFETSRKILDKWPPPSPPRFPPEKKASPEKQESMVVLVILLLAWESCKKRIWWLLCELCILQIPLFSLVIIEVNLKDTDFERKGLFSGDIITALCETFSPVVQL